MLLAHDREEQGFPRQDTTQNTINSNSVAESGTEKALTVATTDAAALVPPEDKLLVFRSLTGIDTVPALTTSGHAARTAPNVGIYTRVVLAEQKASLSYSRFSLLINFCLGLQVIVSAGITAIGAAKGSNKAITAFGAMNTIVAGILTYLKGSGLPDRFKFHKEEWRQVREHIEQREREFCLANCHLDVQEEIQLVEDMYQRVKVRLEGSHTPGFQNEGGGNGGRHGDRAQSTLSMPPPMRSPLKRPESMYPNTSTEKTKD